MYREPALVRIMPDLLYATDNATGRLQSQSGYVFPPFIVLERGTTLRAWLKDNRNFFEIITMVEALVRLLDSLHTAGYVHRDIKVPVFNPCCRAVKLLHSAWLSSSN